MNQAYVTSTLGGNLSGLSALALKASIYPLYMYSSSTVCYSTTSFSTSTMNNVQFYYDSVKPNNNYGYIMDNPRTGVDTYLIDDIVIDGLTMTNVNCYLCTKSLFEVKAITFTLQNMAIN